MHTVCRRTRIIRILLASLLLSICIPVWSWPQVIEETSKLVSPDPNYSFAGPLDLDGNRLIIGATRSEAGQAYSAVFMYERATSAATWTYVGKLIEVGPVPQSDHFLSVAMRGSVAAIATKGSTLVFERTVAGWAQAALLVTPAGAYTFGSDVSIGPAGVVVGGTQAGNLAAYVFEKNAAGLWLLTGQAIGGPASNSPSEIGPQVDTATKFDTTINRIIIGNPHAIPPNPAGVSIFEKQGANWQPLGNIPLVAGPGQGTDGTVVSLSKYGRGVIAFNSGKIAGLVNIFDEEQPGDWRSIGPVRAFDALLNGSELSAQIPDPLLIVVGVPSDEDRGTNSGSISVYSRSWQGLDGPWVQVGKLLVSDATVGTRLGSQVAMDGGTLVAAANGAAYIFELPPFVLPDIFSRPYQGQHDFELGIAPDWTVKGGAWSVVSSGGTHVFRQSSASADASAFPGAIDWENQAIQVDVRALSFNGNDRWFGLTARYLDPANYYYVTVRNSNAIQLKRMVNGVFQTLASAPLNVATGRVYRLRLEAVGKRLRVFVDGRMALESIDSAHTHGATGLRMYQASAQYDNVVVTENPATTLYKDNFQDGSSVEWTTSPGGAWSIVGNAEKMFRQNSIAGDARAVTGIEADRGPPGQIVEVDVRGQFVSGQAGWFGIMAAFKNEQNYYYVTVRSDNTISLRSLNSGSINILDSAAFTVTPGVWYRLCLEVIGTLRAYIDGRLMLEVPPGPPPASTGGGKYGLMTYKATAEYDNFVVTTP